MPFTRVGLKGQSDDITRPLPPFDEPALHGYPLEMSFKSQLSPGIYHIINVKHRNHAVLYDDNDPSTLCSDVVETEKVGHEWRLQILSNMMYAIVNVKYSTFALGLDVLPYGSSNSDVQASIRDINTTKRVWRIECVRAGVFMICHPSLTMCWEVNDAGLGTPIALRARIPKKEEQQWEINKVKDLLGNGLPKEISASKAFVLSLDGSGIYGIAGLVVLERMMQMLAVGRNQPLVPSDVFDLVGGTSSGGLIAILLGRLGLSCATAWREYVHLLAHLSPVEHCDVVDRNNYAMVLREIFRRYTKQRNARMEAQYATNTSGKNPIDTFITTMQIREAPRISCIRSYDAPRGDPDTALNYEWLIYEAAIATCARHPYSPPIRIHDEMDVTKVVPCRDPSLMGYSNPIRMAAAEAECILNKNESKSTPVYISLGSGEIIPQDFSQAEKDRREAESSVATMFHSIATREAEATHMDLESRFMARTYFRLCPKLNIDHMKLCNAHEIEKATTAWLDSRDGRTQMRQVVEAVLGLPLITEPLVPPTDIAAGYNPILDDTRPNDIKGCLKNYDVVFLLDDSFSMATHWPRVISALGGIAQESQGQHTKSFSVQFVKSSEQGGDIASPAAVARTMQGVVPSGRNPLGPSLEAILREHFDRIDMQTQQDLAKVPPLHAVVLTTGDFPDYLQDALAYAGQEILSRRLHPNSIKIQFVLIGESPTGSTHVHDVRAFDPANIVDISLGFEDFNAGRLKHNLVSAMQPNMLSTLIPTPAAVPVIPPEPDVDAIPARPQSPSPLPPATRRRPAVVQPSRSVTPRRSPPEVETSTPIVGYSEGPVHYEYHSEGPGVRHEYHYSSSSGTASSPISPGMLRMHATLHGLPFDVTADPQRKQSNPNILWAMQNDQGSNM